MRIISTPIPQQNYQPKRVAFTSIYYKGNEYRDMFGAKHQTQNSTCKRTDLDYKRLAEISKERFGDFERVNIMPMSVSDGTEAYFVGKSFIEENGMDVFEKKYSPIKSSDVCKDIINKYPKKRLVHLFKGEPEDLTVFNDPMFKPVSLFEYPQQIFDTTCDEPLFKLNQKYQKHFEFETMDFQKRLANMNDEGNSIVLIRNCLKQSFGDMKSAIIAYKMADKLKGASLLVTGDYDRGMPLFESAMDDYFVEIEHNVWAKKDYEQRFNKTIESTITEPNKGKTKNLRRLIRTIKKLIKH